MILIYFYIKIEASLEVGEDYMIDLHTHILAGVDDDFTTINESLEMIKQAHRRKVRDIVLTPRYIRGSKYAFNNAEKKKIFNRLKRELNRQNIKVNIYLGNEVYIDEQIPHLLKSNEIMTINNSKYLLIKLPNNSKVYNIKAIINSIRKEGIIPIIAHPERAFSYYKDYEFFKDLLDQGVLFQIDVASIFGENGKEARLMAKYFLKKNMAHFIATNTKYSYNYYYDYYEYLKAKLHRIIRDDEYIKELLFTNPKNVLDDARIDTHEVKITYLESLKEKIKELKK